jgi:GntR family transcriptional regulator
MRGHGFLATSKVLEQGIIAAPADVAERLEVTDASPVFRLRRLRMADGEPMGLQTAYIAMTLVPRIDQLSFVDASLYEILGTHYALYPASARETHQAVPVPEELAPLLRTPAGSPALAAERLTTLADGRPLEYVQSIMRGDRYKIVLELTRLVR